MISQIMMQDAIHSQVVASFLERGGRRQPGPEGQEGAGR